MNGMPSFSSPFLLTKKWNHSELIPSTDTICSPNSVGFVLMSAAFLSASIAGSPSRKGTNFLDMTLPDLSLREKTAVPAFFEATFTAPPEGKMGAKGNYKNQEEWEF